MDFLSSSYKNFEFQFKDRNIVIYRDDMVEKLCRTAIYVPEDAKVDTIPKLVFLSLFYVSIFSGPRYSPI